MSESPTDLSVLPRLPFTKAVKAVLVGAFPQTGETPWPVGLGAVPLVGTGAAAAPAKPPHLVLHPLWGTTLEGTWNYPDADVEWFYQVDIVGKRVDQLEWARDRVIATFLGRHPGGEHRTPINVEGMRVMSRRKADEDGEPTTTGSAFLSTMLRFGFKVTPHRA